MPRRQVELDNPTGRRVLLPSLSIPLRVRRSMILAGTQTKVPLVRILLGVPLTH